MTLGRKEIIASVGSQALFDSLTFLCGGRTIAGVRHHRKGGSMLRLRSARAPASCEVVEDPIGASGW